MKKVLIRTVKDLCRVECYTKKQFDLFIFVYCAILGFVSLIIGHSILLKDVWWIFLSANFLTVLMILMLVVNSYLYAHGKLVELEKKYKVNLDHRINEKTKEIKQKNEQLEQYASIVSHDLQEPIRSIISLCSIIDVRHGDGLNKKNKQIIDFINKSAHRMDDMVVELLNQARIGYDSVREEIDCNDVVEGVMQDLSKSIEDKNATIVVKHLPRVFAYRIELRMLFQNLISNAVKYSSPSKESKVLIDCVEDDGAWLFSIKDNGIGIFKEDRERIFELFSRLHGSSEYKGVGIGLSQCKKVVELHGGKIWVESGFEKGSTFYFTIPK